MAHPQRGHQLLDHRALHRGDPHHLHRAPRPRVRGRHLPPVRTMSDTDTDTDTNEPQTDSAEPVAEPALDTPAGDADAVIDEDGAAADADAVIDEDGAAADAVIDEDGAAAEADAGSEGETGR